MKYLFIISLVFSLTLTGLSQKLLVSPDGTHLVKEDGTPFVWIGDTAWELFHKLDRDEATEYLKNRAEKGFTIIQAVILAENDGLRIPNAYGQVPFKGMDPSRPNEAYFEHVDFIINKAEELGLFMGLLPTWGDKIYSINPGAGPVVLNANNAAIFGEFLGERYRDKPVVWILGGDRNVASMEVFNTWRALAMGLKKGDLGEHLISYHPRGESISAYWFHNEDWLDFNMYQSGHGGQFHYVYEFAEKAMLYKPRKPFVDGEPGYEDIPIRFWDYMDFSKPGRQRVPEGVLDEDGLIKDRSHFKKGFINEYDVRVHAYWNFLAGACGYTYGNNAIWQMFKKGGAIALPAITDWREAMDRPGAGDMKHVRAFFESRPVSKLNPDQSVIFGQTGGGENHLQAASSIDGSFALIYLAKGQPVEVCMQKISGKAVAWWFDPRDGTTRKIGEFENKGIREFTPPTSGYGNDWMLVIDKKDAGYKQPGVW